MTETQGERAVFRITIRGSMEAVWHELTKTDAPQEAFFNNVLHTDGLRPGGQVRMRTISGKYTGVIGEVLEFDPPRKYSLTFRFTDLDDPVCKVVHELRPVADGVEYTLTVEDLPSGTKTAKQMKQGGTMIINTLKRVVETGRPSLGTRMLFVLFKALEPLAPKRCRTEHWPLPHETAAAR